MIGLTLYRVILIDKMLCHFSFYSYYVYKVHMRHFWKLFFFFSENVSLSVVSLSNVCDCEIMLQKV